MSSSSLQFWIDVGGTFTDCIARCPDGDLRTCKVLSSGRIKGTCEAGSFKDRIMDENRKRDPQDFYQGYQLTLLNASGEIQHEFKVVQFNPSDGSLKLDHAWDGLKEGFSYELFSGEEAPVLAIRYLLGLRLDQAIPRVQVRLGTTRGTNALLERKGARVAYVTTQGFGDLLEIATQARPKLFDLNIVKPDNLYSTVVELDERLDATGKPLKFLNHSEVRQKLSLLRGNGYDSIAVCLLHSYLNPIHEQEVEAIARELGFRQISISSRLTPTIKALHRGDTAVVDAYLAPILEDYLARVRQRLGDSDLRIMTSYGGLVGADHFLAKDSILSGPAGGVVGFVRVAQEGGFEKSIGFDMGGTSTDVCRFDGAYDYQFNTEKAGVRIVAPMYAIETVAAGGGSICRFDGQKLVVGPESAGSHPGPACYGRGGPLTITDVNYYNGKIDEAHFPFPLDREAATRRLVEIQNDMESNLGKKFSLHEIAEGFTQIANHKMAAAIKSISTAKGYDPRNYALVSFGGAGAQHACAIAGMLGIQRILLHPFAGLLSAYGIGMADVKRFSEQTLLMGYSDETMKKVRGLFDQMESKLRAEVIKEGVSSQMIQPATRMLDLRYQGEESTITVREPSDGNFAREFERLHQQLYGYMHDGRPIEMTTIRMEVVGATEKPEPRKRKAVSHRATPSERRQVLFGARFLDAEVHIRSELQSGGFLEGPAIIFENFSTIIVDPGWKATMTEDSNILLEPLATGMEQARTSIEQDPITLELFNNHFTQIATQMGFTLQRTSISVNVKERLDFSCAILDADGELIVNAPHIPVHLGAMGETVKGLLRQKRSELRPGDVYLCNDPDLGGSHLPDLTVMTPVFDPQTQELLFFTASRAHHSEIGGIRPGSASPFARNLAEEGVLFRNFRIVQDHQFREQPLHEALTSGPYPSRSPEQNIADLRAAIAANHVGMNELLKLMEKHSRPVVVAYMKHIRNSAEQKMRDAIRRFPKKRYQFSDGLDDRAPICVSIDVREDHMEIDFAGSGGVNANSLNATFAIVQSAVLYCLRCMIGEDIPLNSGILAPIRLKVPPGMLNPPHEPDPTKHVAVVGGNVEISQRIVDVVFCALSLAAASQGTMNSFIFGNQRFGYYETICGGSGAGPGFHGASAVHTHMTNTRITDVEVLEKQFPVRIRQFSIRRGSGGSGKFKGGDGIVREVEFLEPLEISLLTQRRSTPPPGLGGGRPGSPGRNLLKRCNEGRAQTLDSLSQFSVQTGDVLSLLTPGGGGFGELNG